MPDTTLLSGRLYYLDNLRAFCMVFGVFLHAQAMGSFGIFNGIFLTSGLFRMQTFFWVSGFFAALLISKKEIGEFYRSRLLNLGVPLLSTIILLNPATIYFLFGFEYRTNYNSYTVLEATKYIEGQEFVGGLELHLWFLYVLIGYVLLAPILLRGLSFFIPLFQMLNKAYISLVLALIIGLYWAGFNGAVRTSDIQLYRLVSPFAKYLPFFVCGLLCFRTPKVFQSIHRISLPLVLMVVPLFVIDFMELYSGPAWGLLSIFSKSMMSFLLLNIMLIVFMRAFNGNTPAWKLLSSKIYTIYLFHPFFLYGIAWVMGWHAGDLATRDFIVMSFVCLALCGAVDSFIVKKSKIMTFLFSGRFSINEGKTVK